MKSLGIKKFFLDYLIGSGLILLLFILLTGNITALDTQATFSLSQECAVPFAVDDVLKSAQTVLRKGESCEVISPCFEWQELRCEGSETISSMVTSMLGNDTLVRRVTVSPVKSYGIWQYKDSSIFRIPPVLILILLGYGFILAETGALLFALWRQDKLKQTLALPVGSKRDQLLKPVFYAMLLAVAVMSLNYVVFNQFEYAAVEGSKLISSLLESAAGIFTIVVLAPLAEELIFRGVLLRFFVERNRMLAGVLIVSLLFSAFHGFMEQSIGWQVYVSSIYFVGSLFLCSLYIKQKNIWSPIVFHSAYNSTIVAFYTLSV